VVAAVFSGSCSRGCSGCFPKRAEGATALATMVTDTNGC